MPKTETKRPDSKVLRIRQALMQYEKDHPKAQTTVYRYNSVSVRIRIIDPDFKGMSLADRDDAIWQILDQLPDSVVEDITWLLLFTPREAKTNFANDEFDHPVPSVLP